MTERVKSILILVAAVLLLINIGITWSRYRQAARERRALGLDRLISRRFIFMIGLICVVYGVVFAIMARSDRERGIEAFQKLELNDARRIAQDLERQIQVVQIHLRSLAANPIVQMNRPKKIPTVFRRVFNQLDRRWVRELSFMNAQGVIQIAVPDESQVGADVSKVPRNNAMLKDHHPRLKGPFNVSVGYTAIALQQPIEYNGEFLGWINALLDFDTLTNYFSEPVTTVGISHPGLINREGVILVDIATNLPRRTIFDMAGSDPVQQQLGWRMLRDEEGTFRYVSDYGSQGQKKTKVPRAGAFAKVHLGGGDFWVAGVTAEESEILGQFPAIRWPHVAVFLLFIALVILATSERLRDEHRYAAQLEKEMAVRVEELRCSEGRFRRLFDQSPVGMILLDSSGACLDVNEAFARIFGVPMEYFSGYNLLREPGWMQSELAGHLERAFSNQVGSTFLETRLQVGEGGCCSELPQRDLYLIGAILCNVNAEGELATVLLSCTDSTGRHQAEDARLLLATVVEQSTEAIFLTDTHGVVQYVNPAFCALTGVQSAAALGRHVRRLLGRPVDKVLCRAVLASLEEGSAWHGRVASKRRDGTRYQVEATVSPVRDGSGRVTQYVAVGRDVTLELTLESQLLQSQKMEAVGKLAGGVAHDFNNVLTAIIGNLQLAQMRSGPGVQKNLQDALTASTRATEMVRQLLTFSRKSSGVREPIGLNNLVRETARLVEKSIDRRIELITKLDETLPPVTADPNQIHQVIMNLCVNARDAILARIKTQSENGGGNGKGLGRNYQISIQTRVERVNEDYCRTHSFAHSGRYAVLLVGDEGIGMDRETLARIFEPFFTTKATGQGTGLGLSIVYGIVKSHNGWVHVASQPASGAVFKVYFPIAEAPITEPVA